MYIQVVNFSFLVITVIFIEKDDNIDSYTCTAITNMMLMVVTIVAAEQMNKKVNIPNLLK